MCNASGRGWTFARVTARNEALRKLIAQRMQVEVESPEARPRRREHPARQRRRRNLEELGFDLRVSSQSMLEMQVHGRVTVHVFVREQDAHRALSLAEGRATDHR